MAELLYDVYGDAIEEEEDENNLSKDHVGDRIQLILDKYSDIGLKESDAINYNVPGNRCAYVYLYGVSHSFIIKTILQDFSTKRKKKYLEWIDQINSDRIFNVCSLGAGPGTDIVGVLLFVHYRIHLLSGTKINCTLIDKYAYWENMFETILAGLRERDVINNLFDLSTKYLSEDLLGNLSVKVQQTIRNAHLLTMTKFLSAVAADNRCSILLKTIFYIMKPGALFLYIDNSGGNYYDTIFDAAEAAGLKYMFGPFLHTNFHINNYLKSRRSDIKYFRKFYNASPQENSKISVVIWYKPHESKVTSSPMLTFIKHENPSTIDCNASPILSNGYDFQHPNTKVDSNIDFKKHSPYNFSYYSPYPCAKISFNESSSYSEKFSDNSWKDNSQRNKSSNESQNSKINENSAHHSNYSKDDSKTGNNRWPNKRNNNNVKFHPPSQSSSFKSFKQKFFKNSGYGRKPYFRKGEIVISILTTTKDDVFEHL